MYVAVVDMEALARSWWALLLRGGVAILFGVLTFLQPGISLAALVLVFGSYALSDRVRPHSGPGTDTTRHAMGMACRAPRDREEPHDASRTRGQPGRAHGASGGRRPLGCPSATGNVERRRSGRRRRRPGRARGRSAE